MERDSENMRRFFKLLPEAFVPPGLERRALALMLRARRMEARTRFVWNGIGAVLGLAALEAGFSLVLAQASASGFLSYVRLAFSDLDALISAWKSFLLLIAETAPYTGIALSLAATAAVAFFAARAIASARTAFAS